MDEHEARNGNASRCDPALDDEFVNIHFVIDGHKETACFRPDQVTNAEIKELFRSAAEAGPLDIVKLRKGDKIFNISPHLPPNTPEDPYILQVVGVHPASCGMFETDVMRALDRRVAALERELRDHQEAANAVPCLALRELKKQVDTFRKKLETTEHLSWLGFYKNLPEPVSSEACRRLQYRRKSDSIKRRVREKFLNICDVAVTSSVQDWLRSPTFDAAQWEDEELLLMLQTMFVELELPQKFNIPLTILRNFIYEVYNNYNEVPFHNFRHCFCVAQMMYAIVWAVDLLTKIGDLEVLVLLVSCICHDLDHPGYNNIYQINARTELALRYNDISPLENHHCSVAFRVLEAPECNILASLDSATFRLVREGIIRCILATDMARHNEILDQFTDAVPEFNYASKAHKNLLSMVLIKVADISNEARPMDVAEPWLDSLLQEFFKQSDAEKLEGLPVTPFMDREKVTKPSSQCSFIGLVLLPLFEILGELFPELQELIVEPVRYALDYYRRLNEQQKDERHQRKSVVELGESAGQQLGGEGPGGQVVKSSSSHSVRSRRGAAALQPGGGARSVDEAETDAAGPERGCGPDEEGGGPQGRGADSGSSSDPETATEVEVSEKTLKFKISTESGCGAGCSSRDPGRKSYPGSRKGSREKSSLDYHNHDLAKAVREHERERRRSRGENLSSDVGSPSSGRSNDAESRILEELERDEHQHGQHVVELVFARDRPEPSNGSLILDTAQQRRNNRLNKRTVSVDSNEREVRCCCEDKSNPNSHKSLLTRLRNFTDKLSISFDSKEPPVAKGGKYPAGKAGQLNKSPSMNSSGGGPTEPASSAGHRNSFGSVCRKCNLSKGMCARDAEGPGPRIELSAGEKRSMTLPKTRRSHDSKNKSWRQVFAKEKRPSVSLEALPAGVAPDPDPSPARQHRRNLSNPEGDMLTPSPPLGSPPAPAAQQQISFPEIDVRKPSKPEIFVDQVNPGSSGAVEDIGKVEIRRSSASMEDISKITKASEAGLVGGSLEQHKSDECHAGSLDSMLRKDAPAGKPVVAALGSGQQKQQQQQPQQAPKKSSPGLFSRFRSSMSIDAGTRSSSNSGSLHEQPQQQQQQASTSSGWISSLTASFRPRRQGEPAAQAQPGSPSREEVK